MEFIKIYLKLKTIFPKLKLEINVHYSNLSFRKEVEFTMYKDN